MPDVVLCANRRLARHLRDEHDRQRVAAGDADWQPLRALPVAAWLDAVIDEAMLAGELPTSMVPGLVLNAAQEQLLWQRVIADEAKGGDDQLLDQEGLAATAVEAAQLVQLWNLPLESDGREETQRFLAWRRQVLAVCEQQGWLDACRYRAWQIQCLARGAGRLPASLAFAGFDRYSPQEAELKRVLAARGVAVGELALGRDQPGAAMVSACADRRSECRAAAAWAANWLTRCPTARLGIVAIELSQVREPLLAALDEALHAETLLAVNAAMPRPYNVSLGTPLADEPIVAVALALVQIATQPRRIELARLSQLLRGPYWSAWQSEADGRARLDAAMRRKLPPLLGLPAWLGYASHLAAKGLGLARTLAAIDTLAHLGDSLGSRRLPSAWAETFGDCLRDADWPGERTLTSREWQAREALHTTLDQLAALDVVVGRIAAGEAGRHLVRLCRERVFQPETVGTPSIEVMGPLEAAGLSFDALWVLGANDDAWPPPPRPNPLLPAAWQRRARSTNASAAVQLEFAQGVQRRLLRAAPEIVFSWARGEADRQLRPSPLLAGLPEREAPQAVPSPAARQVGCGHIERLADHRGPPLGEGESVVGGTGLFKAQALCPAWAFYRYRLGARPLDEPVEGLDALDRGTLLHQVMERFFFGRRQTELAAMSEAERQVAMGEAVAAALASFSAERLVPLPPRFAALEQRRLVDLLAQWLAVELARPLPFSVLACEQQAEVVIEGIRVTLKADRIDELDDGRRLIVDYKTGEPNTRGWSGERLSEPQLPIYATHSGASGVTFAKVRVDDCGYLGWADVPDLGAGIEAVNWSQVIGQWQSALARVASEIRSGYAAVTFADERDLDYCDVRPLLRLPEVRMQREES